MSSDDRLIAARYVQALFDLAAESNQHDTVKKDMEMLKSVLTGSDEFQKLLSNPVMTREDSESAVSKVLDAIKASDLTRKFFALLARNRRLSISALAIDKYLEMLAESRGELAVQITTAQPLSAAELKTLTDSIAKSTGKKVNAQVRENPAILGGLQVRVGSKMLDNSVAGKLDRLKQKLESAA